MGQAWQAFCMYGGHGLHHHLPGRYGAHVCWLQVCLSLAPLYNATALVLPVRWVCFTELGIYHLYKEIYYKKKEKTK